MDFPPTAYIGAGAIIAAFISGLWSLISLAISKDQKVSEFRQNWIDSLRKEFSDYIGKLTSFSVLWMCHSKDGPRENLGRDFIQENIQLVEELEAMSSQIVLRLNPSEHENLLKTLEDIDKLISSPRKLDANDMSQKNLQLRKQAQVLLKGEWERVKAGEKGFRYFRNASYGVVVVVLVAASWTLFFNK